MLTFQIVLMLLALAGLLLASTAMGVWRRQRRRSRLLAERLIVEGHIEQLTAQTLQAMRRMAREQLRSQR